MQKKMKAGIFTGGNWGHDGGDFYARRGIPSLSGTEPGSLMSPEDRNFTFSDKTGLWNHIHERIVNS